MKLNRLLIPVVAVLLIAGAALMLGAQPKPSFHVPPGDLVDSPNASSMQEMARKPVPDAPALPDGSQEGATIESFDGSSTDGWQGINELEVNWIASDGRLQQNIPVSEVPGEQNAMFVTRDTSFADGSVETYFYPTAGSPLGIVLRGSANGYYRVVFYMNVNTNQLSKAEIQLVTTNSDGNTQSKTLTQADYATWRGYDLERWTLAQATIKGDRIAVSIDGHEIMSASDDTNAFTQGWAGVWTQSDGGTQFDNIRIQRSAGR